MIKFKEIIIWLLSASDSSTDERPGHYKIKSKMSVETPLPSWTKTLFWYVAAILLGLFAGRLT